MRRKPTRRPIELVVATCSGLHRLMSAVGLPIAHLDLAYDAAEACKLLNTRRHGACRANMSGRPVLVREPGWNDWVLSDLGSAFEADTFIPYGVSICDGRIRLDSATGGAMPEIRESFAAAVRHLRFQDFVRRPAYMEGAGSIFGNVDAWARYTAPAFPEVAGARLVEDCFVIDPVDDVSRLIWTAIGAIRAATDQLGSNMCS